MADAGGLPNTHSFLLRKRTLGVGAICKTTFPVAFAERGVVKDRLIEVTGWGLRGKASLVKLLPLLIPAA